MITLYAFGPMLGLPDPSPPCMKAHALLKMAGLDYRLDRNGFGKAPKGKLPFIDDAGTLVPDSTFIRWHLEAKTGLDFDAGLSDVERGVSWAFEKLAEDNLYYALAHDRWVVDENFKAGPGKFFNAAPAPVRPALKWFIRRSVRKTLKMQGTGRHTPAEIDRIAIRGIDAIAAQLGEKPWLMGDAPCAADAAVHATMTALLCPVFDTAQRRAAERHANLVAYRDRGLARWFPDFSPTR